MTPSEVGTSKWLIGELTQARVLEPEQLHRAADEFHRTHPEGEAHQVAEFLVHRRILTPFQAERALEGEARKLVLGPYILVDAIGTGSLGQVYRAIGRGDRLTYAVKVLPLRSLWNVRLARKQVRSFSALPSHPAIVPFVDVGSAAGMHYLVWPYVQGITLDRVVLEQGPLTFSEAATVAIQVTEGLVTCHPRDIFHGLLKPSNVMIGPDGQTKLLDFGIGALLAENLEDEESLIDTISMANAAAGMLDCAAPESISDPTNRTPAGDQYSLGCTLYFALSGRYPFPDGNTVEKMAAHQTQKPPPLRSLIPDIPGPLDVVIARLMQKDPAARYGDLTDLMPMLASLSQKAVTVRPKARKSGSDHDEPVSRLRTGRLLGAAGESGIKGDSFEVRRPPEPPPVHDTEDEPPHSQLVDRPALPADEFSMPSGPGASPPVAILGSPEHVPPAPVRPPPARKSERHPAPPPVTPEEPLDEPLPPPPPPPPPRMPMPGAGQPRRAAPPPVPQDRLRIQLPPMPPPSTANKLKKAIFFWQAPADPVQCSVFAVPQAYSGEMVTVKLFIHHPQATRTVEGLAAAFPEETHALGAAYLTREILRDSKLSLYLDVQYAHVPEPLIESVWNGQAELLAMNVQIAADCPPGPIQAILSLGQNDVLVGQVSFQLQIIG